MFFAILVLLIQAPPANAIREIRANGRVFSVLVPSGWKAEDAAGGGEIRLEHTGGASFIFRSLGTRGISSLESAARVGLDRTMLPLGFASFGEPLQRKVNGAPAIQYEIQGNRLSHHRKLLYLAIRRENGFFEMIYENSEAGYALLLAEAERIGGSIEQRVAGPATRGRGGRPLRESDVLVFLRSNY